MTADFVLDENVYVRALESEDTREPDDELAALLIQCLQVRHRWVLTGEVMKSYYRQFAPYGSGRGVIATRMIASLTNVVSDSNRFLIRHAPPVIPGDYDHDDDHMVAAVADLGPGTLLITLDVRLRNSLRSAAIPDNHHFRVIDVQEALSELCARSE